MSTEPTNPRLIIDPKQTSFTGQQMQELRRLGYVEGKKADLDAFFQVAKTYGLNPFSGEVVQIGRWGQYRIQVTITGFRKIVSTMAYRDGFTFEPLDAYFVDDFGERYAAWPPEGEDDSFVPAAAVHSLGVRGRSYLGAAAYTEYVAMNEDGTVADRWEENPGQWLANIAESLAWREVFPLELENIRLNEEMRQADMWTPERKGKDDYGNMKLMAADRAPEKPGKAPPFTPDKGKRPGRG